MIKNKLLYDHCITLKPKLAVTYWKSRFREPHERHTLKSRTKHDKFSLSKAAKVSMNNCFQWLRIISNEKKVYSKKENFWFKFELSFITLTLSDVQRHSDDFIKAHMLSPFLKWLQRSWSVNSYIWKAEVQNNGNIHFHITTNKFIHHKSIRAKWNRLLAKNGYCKVFQDGSNDKGDSATNIKAVKNNSQIESYIANYCTKKDTYKMKFNESTGKKEYYQTETIPDNNHFYHAENYRKIICCDGSFREYKRQVHGRLWNATYNLNVSPLQFTDKDESYPSIHNFLTNNKNSMLIEKDYANIYIFNKKIFPCLPQAAKNGFRGVVRNLRFHDKIQTQLTIETIY